MPHLWSRELLQADLGYRNGFDEKIMHWIPNAKPQAETSCSNKRSHLCRFRCGCWLGLRNLHWILLILLGPGHFLQWLWHISILCIRCLGLERVTFECLLYINRLFCTCLEVRNSSFRLAEGHGTFWRYLQDYISGYFLCYSQNDLQLSCSLPRRFYFQVRPVYHSVLHSQPSSHTTHEWEAVWISRWCLNQEFIPPAIESIETFRVVDIVNQNTAVSAPIERYS